MIEAGPERPFGIPDEPLPAANTSSSRPQIPDWPNGRRPLASRYKAAAQRGLCSICPVRLLEGHQLSALAGPCKLPPDLLVELIREASKASEQGVNTAASIDTLDEFLELTYDPEDDLTDTMEVTAAGRAVIACVQAHAEGDLIHTVEDLDRRLPGFSGEPELLHDE